MNITLVAISFIYEHTNDPLVGPQGFHGDTILVNGTYAPFTSVPRGWVRLRLLNASNGRRYNFGFSDNRPFYQIATDGGLLEVPVKETRLLLAPASRAEIVVDMSDGAPITLMSYAVKDTTNNPTAMINLRENILNLYKHVFRVDTDENQQFKLLELRPAAELGQSSPLPPHLNTIPRWNEQDAVKTRKFVLNNDAMINGMKMDPAHIDQIVHKDDVEIWEITSPAPGFHTFHVHGVQMLILDHNGKDPSPGAQGWIDNILLGPGDTVRVMLQFKYYTDPHRPYMFHCHILEHEDMGMMGQFVVMDKETRDEDVWMQKEYVDEYLRLLHH